MNVSDMLDDILKRYMKASEHDCWKCEGSGKYTQMLLKPEIIEEDEYRIQRYPKVVCPECNGDGHVRPKWFQMGGTMSTEALRFAVQARDDARFGDMNEAMDWAIAFLDRCTKAIMNDEESVEALRDLVPKLFAPTQEDEDADTEPLRGAMTPEELAALGVLDE